MSNEPIILDPDDTISLRNGASMPRHLFETFYNRYMYILVDISKGANEMLAQLEDPIAHLKKSNERRAVDSWTEYADELIEEKRESDPEFFAQYDGKGAQVMQDILASCVERDKTDPTQFKIVSPLASTDQTVYVEPMRIPHENMNIDALKKHFEIVDNIMSLVLATEAECGRPISKKAEARPYDNYGLNTVYSAVEFNNNKDGISPIIMSFYGIPQEIHTALGYIHFPEQGGFWESGQSKAIFEKLEEKLGLQLIGEYTPSDPVYYQVTRTPDGQELPTTNEVYSPTLANYDVAHELWEQAQPARAKKLKL